MAENKRNGGFSLIEIVVSIAVVTLFTAAIAGCFTHAVIINNRSSAMLQAEMAVSRTIEEMRAEGFDKNKALSVESVSINKADGTVASGEAFKSYNGDSHLTVSVVDYNASAPYYDVIVSYTTDNIGGFNGSTGKPVTVSVEATVHRKP